MTKIEGVFTSELLKDYLKRHYPNDVVMVVWRDPDSMDEWNTLLKELEEAGIYPPVRATTHDFLIFAGDNAGMYHYIIDKHDHGSFRIEMYDCGICVHENC